MKKLVLTSRFRRFLRKFIRHDQNLQARIEETLQQMEIDLFAANLATHQLKGEFDGLRACSCRYDCRNLCRDVPCTGILGSTSSLEMSNPIFLTLFSTKSYSMQKL
ncbi:MULTISPECIES: hypothetical protein [Nostocales]|jgi:mRNA-degrading endonuclease YafQ of YafQ-DinJ toxin-antitoxin module|uniref:Uncharacterized protein n=2 Tax=Aphanizomenonaceae TaxID=1892259 RepID=A0ACC7S5I6_DOLFA|nr:MULTISPECIES: hypothetical protein [Nostocales]MBO1070337.1 hypothetical protein [Dolichospermum sp. DEX189]MCX5984853.1 hypothetical protein [Nostocales cyanobacterium LacPavin_0920_SED1_MAG_38_18]MBD2281477.1 hypothetical protein [Aphanizomenon flos-aquae FACHB-1040]MBO1064582.1 hypothetical protein [Anabaena sp. 54]MTJ43451.1 hypothetical protein [Dolichospermum flos-aquae UHCC 0037]